MVMTVTESTSHECQILFYTAIQLSIAQFLVRLVWINGLLTTLLLAAGFTIYSTAWITERALPLTVANLGFRAASDIVGFLAGIVGFLFLLVLTRTTELVFTREALLSLVSGGGVSVSDVFLTIGLTYSSNLSLFAFSRFLVNFLSFAVKLIGNLIYANNGDNTANAAPAVAPRGRGRPRGQRQGRNR